MPDPIAAKPDEGAPKDAPAPKESENDSGKPAAEGDGKGEGKEGELDLDPAKHEIPKRGAASFIIERQAKKIEKLRENAKDDKGADDLDEEGNLTPEARSAIHEEIAPVTNALKKQADDAEVGAYLASNPEHKKYEPLVRKYLADPDYAAVPVAFIFAGLTAKDQQKIGADKQRKADEENRAKQLGGSSGARGGEGQTDYSKLSNDEMEAEIQRVKTAR